MTRRRAKNMSSVNLITDLGHGLKWKSGKIFCTSVNSFQFVQSRNVPLCFSLYCLEVQYDAQSHCSRHLGFCISGSANLTSSLSKGILSLPRTTWHQSQTILASDIEGRLTGVGIRSTSAGWTLWSQTSKLHVTKLLCYVLCVTSSFLATVTRIISYINYLHI